MSDRLHRWIDRIERFAYRSDWGIRLGRALGTPATVRVVRHTVQLDGYPPGAPPLHIGFASDFHAGPTTDPRLLAGAFAALKAAAPDLILLGGDFVSLEARYVDRLFTELATLKAPLGRYAVLGNHDHWTSATRIERCLKDAGIEVLTNRNTRLPPPFESIWLCGLDDHWHGRPDAAAALAGTDGVRILLMHAPSGLLDVHPHRFDLALSGHTHGGQIALPGGKPLLLPHGDLSGVYSRGRFETGSGTLIVSVGLGCSVLPIRLFSDPEILLCEVRGAK
jgi:predicted MPP superfamily phosphohydrolase